MRSAKSCAAHYSARSEIRFKRQMVQAREDAGLSQYDIALRMGLSVNEIQGLEMLDSDPTFSTVRQYLTCCESGWDLNINRTPDIKTQVLKEGTN